uniref:Uncharacterized protein n=1 Tax=Aegilops tauschii subsp. strangulata TaxID=200361 RepID=A0A453K4U1_AEGTS
MHQMACCLMVSEKCCKRVMKGNKGECFEGAKQEGCFVTGKEPCRDLSIHRTATAPGLVAVNTRRCDVSCHHAPPWPTVARTARRSP